MKVRNRGQASPMQIRSTTEHLIAKFDINAFHSGRLQQPQVSPDNRRIAYITHTREGARVVVDQNLGKIYSALSTDSLSFSPDSQNIAYVATRDKHTFIVIGDQEHGPYGQMIDCSPAFSFDSKHFAYAAQQEDKVAVFLDNTLVGRFDGIGDTLVYSPDSRSLAFRARSGKKEYIVMNDRAGKQYDKVGNPHFSPDGRRLAYVARKDDKWFIVADGQERRPFDHALHPVFSPNSQRLAYYAGNEQGWFVVVDEELSGPYFEFGIGAKRLFRFSPNSKRLACIGAERKKWFAFHRFREFAVVDGLEGKRYKGAANLRFSPDSRRVAYLASRGRRYYVIADSKEHGPYTAVGPASPVFSPDSKQFAYSACTQNKWAAYIDGIQSGVHYKRAKTPIFSPDSRTIAYTVATTDDSAHVVINGDPGPNYHAVFMINGGSILFDSPSSLHYIANRENRQTLLVTEEIGFQPQT